MNAIRLPRTGRLLPAALLLLLAGVLVLAGRPAMSGVEAAPATATIGGGIFTGSQNLDGTPNTTTAAPLMGAQVMVQNQHSGGAFITYGTVTGNSWTATVPAPGDYIVMFSAPGHDATSREFTVAEGDVQAKDAFLPPLPLPPGSLLVYSFYDNMVNGEDDAPDDPPLNGVTWTVTDEDGAPLATGVTGSQPSITLPDGSVIADTAGLYYFTNLPPGEVIATSDPSTAYLASNPGFNFDATTEFYLMSSEEGGHAWDPKLYPGDPGTEAGGYLVWHGYVEKLGQLPPSPDAGSISGTLLDADMAFDPAEPDDALLSARHPGVSANTVVPDGFVVLFTDMETIPTHPVATTEADPVTGEYSFLNVPPGRYKMFVSDVPIDYVWVQQALTVGADEHLTGVDPLVPRFFARGQGYVYDNSTIPPTPIAGATVRMRLKDGSVWKKEVTDASGWYNFDDLPEVEVMGYVDVEPPPGYRGAIITDTFYPNATFDETCDPSPPGPPWPPCVDLGTPYDVTHNGMNRYMQWYTANYRADLYLEPVPAGEADIGGFAFNDHFTTGTWVGDGVFDEDEERTFEAVTVELWDATGTTMLATTMTGKFDETATAAQGWRKPYTWPPDEWGGVFVGPLPGYFEFRGLAPGDYLVKVTPPAGFAPSPAGSETVAVTVSGGDHASVNFGMNTTPPGSPFGVPLAGEIEGGVFDDLNLETQPLSLLFMEKAGIPGVPVGVYDHLGYNLGVGYMGHPWCYDGSTICPPGQPPVQKPEVERRFASGVHIYVGNDPSFPGYNPCYTPLTLAYEFGQGKYKFEADWSLVPNAFLPGGGWLDCSAPLPLVLPMARPAIDAVTPGGSWVITGSGFGAEQGYSTVTLSGREMPVISWSDTEIHVADSPDDVSGPVVVTTTDGPSNGMYLDTGLIPPQSVFVDAANWGTEDGTQAHPWNTISEALQNLPAATPRYVFVAAGTYHERVQVSESDVYLIGAGPMETILDATATASRSHQGFGTGGGPAVFVGAGGMEGSVSNVVVSGFTITGGSVDDEIGAGIFGDYGNSSLDINNNVIVRNSGYYGGGIWLHLSNHDVQIWSNTIAENGNYGGYAGGISVNDEPEYATEEHGEPEHVWDDHNPGPPPGSYEIHNNHIFHNFSPDYGGGVSLYEVKDHLKIYGNVIEDNKADDHGGGAFFEDTGPIDIHENEFLRNYSRDDGGAISFEDVGDDTALVDIYNNLFAENVADDCGENTARGGALAFDDTFYVRVFNNTIVANVVAGSRDPAGGGIDSERNGHEYNGSDPLGRDVAPGFSNPWIFNNIIWGNMRLEYDQMVGDEEEDGCTEWGVNHEYTEDNLHVDNPALQPEWESHGNSGSFSNVEYNDISDGSYGDRTGNMATDPLFVEPASGNWRLAAGSPVIDQAPACGAPRIDLDTHPRSPKEGLIDMGAYEYQWANPGSITIVKAASPADGMDFGFTGDLGCFSLDDAATNGDAVFNTITFEGLSAGTYEIYETAVAGWELLDVQCSTSRFELLSGPTARHTAEPVTGVSVDLVEDEAVTCTFENLGPPDAPGDLVATVVSADQVDLTWSDNSDVEESFRLERATDPAFSENLTPETLPADTEAFSDTSVTEGTTYFYRVLAVNSAADSPPSNVAEARVVTPAAPSVLLAQASGRTQIDLSWIDNSDDEEGFRLERASDENFSKDVHSESIAPNTTSFNDRTVVAGTTYFYRIYSVNPVGDSDASNVASATTLQPAPAARPLGSQGGPAALPNTGGGSGAGPFGLLYAWLVVLASGAGSIAIATVPGSRLSGVRRRVSAVLPAFRGRQDQALLNDNETE